MKENKLGSQKNKGYSIIYRKKLKKFEKYSLYNERVEHRIELLYDKIDANKKKIKEINLNITDDNVLYNRYERELLSLERSMKEIFSLYGIKKSNNQMINILNNCYENDEFFTKIKEIREQIENIKIIMLGLEASIAKKFKTKDYLKKQKKMYYRRIAALEYYLDYLYSEAEYMKLYTKNNNSKKRIIKK